MNPLSQEPLRNLDDILRFERARSFEERVPMRSIHGLLAAAAERFGERPALTMVMTGEDDEVPRALSYRELYTSVTRAANLFVELGGAGTGVAYLLPNLLETQITLWGAATAGYAVPLNFLLQPPQIAELVRASGAKILVALGPHPALDIWQKALRVREMIPGLILVCVAPPTQALPEGVLSLGQGLARQSGSALAGEVREGDTVCAYFHTGGTTGAPKLVTQTHRSQLAAAFGGAVLMDLRETDVLTHGMPLFHVGGTTACSLSIFFAGAHGVMLSPAGLRSPVMVKRYWRLSERYGATIVGGVPTSLAALSEVPVDADLSRVRFAITGAAAAPRAVVERFEAHTGKRVHELLGMTEASGLLAVDVPAGERTIGSVGYRLPYIEMRVRRLGEGGTPGDECAPGEIGVLAVRGPCISPGYRDPAQNKGWMLDGWLDTGDLAYIDASGKLYMAGRAKDLIIRGGHNIDPQMIEEAFTAHPAVALAAAVGEPDAYAGELPVAYVTLRPGASATAGELRSFVEARIAERPAWPRQIHILPEMPLTAIGKVYKPALRVDATRRVAATTVTEILGHAPEALSVEPGGKRGMKVTVTLAAADAARRAELETALQKYLFESVLQEA